MNKRYDVKDIKHMIGCVFTSVQGGRKDDEQIVFSGTTPQGVAIRVQFVYEHDCCANCSVEDICGDWNDLLGVPLLQAEQVSFNNHTSTMGGEIKPLFVAAFLDDPADVQHIVERTNEDVGSWTWTFYRFATIKGAVTVRWFGSSNGYYSESVSVYVHMDGVEQEES